MGHVMASCAYTAAEHFGPASRVAKNKKKTSKRFANLDEMRDSAAQRLQVQETEAKMRP